MVNTLLGRLSESLLLPKNRLDYLIRSAPYRYKVYTVPKRSGAGNRIIAQPAREVKRMQYWVLKNIFQLFPIHDSALGYVKEKNILSNASPHVSNPYMLKLDFRNFFPSIKGNDFLQFTQNIDSFTYPTNETEMLIKILFWRPKGFSGLRLSIGAPTSPSLSNAIMFNFDSVIYSFCLENGIVYTRYADDMTFSMQEKDLRGIILNEVISTLRRLPYPRLFINNRKTVFASKAHRRMVTGLIITNDGSVSIGRGKKRLIRAQIHNFLRGNLNEGEQEHLRGMLAFVRNIEPDFIARMIRKYGADSIGKI